MSVADSLGELEHDHADLHRRVRDLGAAVTRLERGDAAADAAFVSDELVELRDDLFLHFAREEDGLFPFLVEVVSNLEATVNDLVAVHDEICGIVARMVHVVGSPHPSVIAPLFRRFEAAYARHAQLERALFQVAAVELTPAHRATLGALLLGL